MDTLAIQRRLLDAGFPDKQATAVTDVIRSTVTDYAATKADLDNLASKLTVRMGVMMAAGLTLLFLALEFTPG